ncbi:hypothetical protein [Pseudomonas sp. WHRI 8519]|uniref:hypothetical protein n=1 Tax=Pseudomonas sp. WHRI 8519 TaxID=3162567 RepID=UPI0032EF21B2
MNKKTALRSIKVGDIFCFVINGGGYGAGRIMTRSINGFNSIKFGSLPIETSMKEYASQDRRLQAYIPFAYESGGSTFMVSLNKEDAGMVKLGRLYS